MVVEAPISGKKHPSTRRDGGKTRFTKNNNRFGEVMKDYMVRKKELAAL
jgi:hypothetical protein